MSSKTRNYLFLLSFALATYSVSQQMRKHVPGPQVVRFEFLRTAAHADAWLQGAEWQRPDAQGMTGTEHLRRATYWDFLYILSYVGFFLFLARVCLGAGAKQLKTMTLMLVAAGLADLAENSCLLQILDGGRGLYPALMFCFASVKFGLLALFVVWLLVAGFLRLRSAAADR